MWDSSSQTTLGLEAKIAPTIKGQTSGTLSHWLMPYKVERGKVSFQCGTLQVKKDYKCNTWS